MSGSTVVAGSSPVLATAEVGSQGSRVLAVDRLAGGDGRWPGAKCVGPAQRLGHETGAWTLLMDDGGWQEGGAAGDVWE